ncbi:MAG: hypothetical protein QOF76_3872 [Solirubrobacteraceae bacterium]|jgi:hypothetical protein|nr:hypothetical protein [Solirubrobacteraceae bacterium]
MRTRVAVLTLLVLGLTGTASAAPSLTTLSNRADLISGGDALVQVTPSRAKVSLNGTPLTGVFAKRADGRTYGLVKGLRVGKNVLIARARNGRRARLIIVNHPIGGPVLAGPQIKPWSCFAGALDDQCNRDPAYSWYYKSKLGASLTAFDGGAIPADADTTTTDEGKTVPFVVREEVGSLDRDEYRVATLFDPTQPWEPYAPQDQFNHKLVITHGASCDTEYKQADAPDVLKVAALGKGFVVMSHALDNAGHNCNIATQAESLIMTKEHVIDTYGTVRYTIGTGCSGGSLVQQQVANAYPGLYQGITPACSFTDAWSSSNQYVDYQLLLRYFNDPGRWSVGSLWTPLKMAAVEGHINPINAVTFTTVIPSSGDPSHPCPGVDPKDVYNSETNPKGVRCSLQDYMVNVFGRRPSDGFARRPYDNTGVQYGLKALISGAITPAEFVDINVKIGGSDYDYHETKARVAGDRKAIRRAYKSGAINQGDNLDRVGIIDLRGPDPGAFHDVYRTYTMRARLEREHGTADNQILWRGQVPLLGDASYQDQAVDAMDGWLEHVAADHRKVPLAQKLLDDKPIDLGPRCTDGAGLTLDATICDATVQAYSDPRQVAGEPAVDDIEKCNLKPLSRGDYGEITFTEAQWAALQGAFPSGVCDWSKTGVGRVPTTPWQTYQTHGGKVIYGGKGLGRPPRSHRMRRR